jgi:hypothetical protein
MEALIHHVNKNKDLQDAIVTSENYELIEATYRLFLHHGLSMEYFLKTGFRYELQIQGVESIFRENRKMNHLIKNFFDMNGGKFDYITNSILEYATLLKMKKDHYTTHSQKKVLIKCMDCLNDMLIHNMSDCLIDFCSDVCLCINTKSESTDRHGENIVCSFIVFRLLAPRLLDLNCCGSSPPEKVLTVVKLLNRVASSNSSCLFKQHQSTFERLINHENSRLTTTIARTLMMHREANYCHLKKLSQVRSSQANEVFLKGFAQISLDDLPEILPDHLALLEQANSIQKRVVIGDGLEYFLLWSPKAVLKLVEMENLDYEFFKHWNLNGADFLELSTTVLKMMGMKDEDTIKQTLQSVKDISQLAINSEVILLKKPLSKWSLKDISVWLTIGNFTDLISTFKSYRIFGKKLNRLTASDLNRMKISRPSAIQKLLQLVNLNADTLPSSSEDYSSTRETPRSHSSIISNFSISPVSSPCLDSPSSYVSSARSDLDSARTDHSK